MTYLILKNNALSINVTIIYVKQKYKVVKKIKHIIGQGGEWSGKNTVIKGVEYQ